MLSLLLSIEIEKVRIAAKPEEEKGDEMEKLFMLP